MPGRPRAGCRTPRPRRPRTGPSTPPRRPAPSSSAGSCSATAAPASRSTTPARRLALQPVGARRFRRRARRCCRRTTCAWCRCCSTSPGPMRRAIVNGVTLGGRAPVLRDPVARHALWRVVDSLVGAVRAASRHRHVGPLERARLDDRARGVRRRGACRRAACASASANSRCTCAGTPRSRSPSVSPARSACRCVATSPSTCCRCTGTTISSARAPLAQRPRVPWSERTARARRVPDARQCAAARARSSHAAREAGYAAAWPWSLHADDTQHATPRPRCRPSHGDRATTAIDRVSSTTR